ncbi:MAG: phosphodiester glycosidase family protein, partial [Clostridia bacterium]|nr:phosphodiester glycosidase family protein [Clostridia bacterium]
NGAVAAINGDFFARNAWDKASTIGLVVRDGMLQSTQSEEINGATLAFDEAGFAVMDYIKTSVVFTAANGNSIKIKEINKYDSLKEPVVYTSAFSAVTGGSYDNILEVVVVDGVVTEMRRNMDGVEVPENGYVIRHLPEYDTFLWENVQIGDEVTLTVETSLNIESFKSASAGGTLLVQDGKKCTLTHSITGTNPRTMAGINKDGTKLYLITVDGRSGSSAGLTMQGMQDLALELGLNTAINLDGGGSTTMVTRNPEKNSLEVNNTPSDGSLRTVPVGLGVFSRAPKGNAETIVLSPEKNEMLPETSQKIRIAYVLDTYGNPCKMPVGNIEWTTDNGKIQDGVLTPERPGKTTVTASVDGATGNTQIFVADYPTKLVTEPLSVPQNGNFKVFGVDEKGNRNEIKLSDVTVKERDGYKQLSFGSAEGKVYLQPENTDDFETTNGTLSVYPSGTEGSYVLTDEKAVSGTKSGKLSFDFKRNADTQAVYLTFDQPKIVPKNMKYMGVYVYAPYENYQWLRVQGEDDDGNPVRVTLSDSMEFSGWQYLSTQIPKNLKKITSVYVVQNGKKVAAENYILLDDFSFTEAEYNGFSQPIEMSEDKSVKGYKIAVTGESGVRNTLYGKLYDSALKKRLQSADADQTVALGLKGAAEHGTDVFYAFSEGNTAGLVLAANVSGISGADNTQWSKIRQYAETHDNLLLFLNQSPEKLPNRQDEVLFGIIKNAGCENVYVFYPGVTNGITAKDGVYHVTVSGLKYAVGSVLLDQMQYERFAEITLKNGDVHIAFPKVYE